MLGQVITFSLPLSLSLSLDLSLTLSLSHTLSHSLSPSPSSSLSLSKAAILYCAKSDTAYRDNSSWKRREKNENVMHSFH